MTPSSFDPISKPNLFLSQWPRIALVWVFTPLIALASWRFLIGGVEMTMPHMMHHVPARELAFYLHILLAPVALILVPFQFWTRLRTRRPALHRWLGRLYAVAILISGIAGLQIAIGTNAGPVAAWGFGLLAVLWMAVTGYAVWLAVLRRIADHRRWMIRSAALTLAGTTLRLELPLLAMGFGFETGYVIVAWACWVPNALLAEWLLRRQRQT
ncbi:hypothetical protein TL5118_03608 [Thalassovita autumnalis]|uniref:Membrane protein (DUF2306) n=1 Tax=Thalassovita autumnalis TaxID=2072972 RepID=A0A0P1FMK7_9RHOB|nr:DUF2306 domain-containing protein [Thalassovita autumnalis]CUH69639.1 hypothetical protein TL5118_03608 [Thalassovita autumnalis]CUH73042.1 hypothetical protein TL5120_02848 [Thalassovita autumnalis]